MIIRPLTLISEDLLSEALAQRLLAHVAPDAGFAQRLGRRGLSHVTSRLRKLNEAANGLKIVAIVDRDRPQNCPIQLIQEWLGGPRNPNLVVRFAEMEIESWIMSDRERLAEFLSVPVARLPEAPDTLLNAKETLVNIARRSRDRQVREGLCPQENLRHPVGPLYNVMLEAFIRTRWRAPYAAARSPSLRRAEQRIRELTLR